jgi:hypothetical protein
VGQRGSVRRACRRMRSEATRKPSRVRCDRSAERVHARLRDRRRERRCPFGRGKRSARGTRPGRRNGRRRRGRRETRHRRDADHRSLQLIRDGRRPRRRLRPEARTRCRSTRRRRIRRGSRLIHHQHGALELRRGHALEVKIAFRTRLSRIRVLRATVRTEHSRTSVNGAAPQAKPARAAASGNSETTQSLPSEHSGS